MSLDYIPYVKPLVKPKAIRKPLTPEQKKRASEKARAWQLANPERTKVVSDKWRKANKDKLRKAAEKWRNNNPEKFADTVLKFYQARRWYKSWQSAKSRCNNPNTVGYEYYGGRGVEFHLTQDDCRYMWERDNAASMNVPSLDRIDSFGHYVLANCRYIEANENSRLGGMNTAKSIRAKRAIIDAERLRAKALASK